MGVESGASAPTALNAANKKKMKMTVFSLIAVQYYSPFSSWSLVTVPRPVISNIENIVSISLSVNNVICSPHYSHE